MVERTTAEGKSAPKGSQSIHRAMALLSAVGERNATGIRLKDLVRLSGLHTATAHRLLAALQWEQMLTLDSYSKRYFLGVRLHGLVDSARFAGIKEHLRETMIAIAEKTGDVVYLYLPIMNDLICVDRIEGDYPVRALIRDVGARLPCGIGAGGLAILARLPEARAKAIVSANAQRYPEYNNITQDKVWRAVASARKSGYGLNREQVLAGITGVGIAVCDSRGEPRAAITVVSIAKRMNSERLPEVVGIATEQIKLAQPIPDALL